MQKRGFYEAKDADGDTARVEPCFRQVIVETSWRADPHFACPVIFTRAEALAFAWCIVKTVLRTLRCRA